MQRKGEILKYIAQIGKFSDQKRKFGGLEELRFPFLYRKGNIYNVLFFDT